MSQLDAHLAVSGRKSSPEAVSSCAVWAQSNRREVHEIRKSFRSYCSVLYVHCAVVRIVHIPGEYLQCTAQFRRLPVVVAAKHQRDELPGGGVVRRFSTFHDARESWARDEWRHGERAHVLCARELLLPHHRIEPVEPVRIRRSLYRHSDEPQLLK